MIRYLIGSLIFLMAAKDDLFAQSEPAHAPHSIAILPAHVDIKLKRNENKKVTDEDVKAATLKMSFIVQSEMYNWFADKQKKYHFNIALQDSKLSNETIFAGGLSFEDYEKISSDSLARMLHVDAVVFCNMDIVKKLTDDEAAGLTVLSFALFGLIGGRVIGTTNVDFHLSLSDNVSTKNLWPQEEQPLIGYPKSMDEMLERELKWNAKAFPYRKKK